MNLLTQIVHFTGSTYLGDLESRVSLVRAGFRTLSLRCIHLQLLIFSTLLSTIHADDFQSGLDAYHESKYAEATVAFDRSLKFFKSAATHHNLALSLYQQDQTAAAVWQLESALRLAPLNKTYVFKLGALRQMLGLYDSPTIWWQGAANILSKKTLVWIASGCFWMLISALTLPYLGGFQRPIFLNFSSGIAAVCILLSVVALTIQIKQQPSGIVISNEAVDLHHAPASASPEAGVARPGERAYIIDQHNDFLKVETEAEITGWIQIDAFRKL